MPTGETFNESFESFSFYDLFVETAKWEKIVYQDFIDFLNEYFNTNIKVKLKFKNLKSNEAGYVNFNDTSIILSKNSGVEYNLGVLSHEFTHLKQIAKKELSLKDDFLYFKNKPIISKKEYENINNFKDQQNLPFEKEAYKNQKELTKKYNKSRLKGVDPIIDLMWDL
jgi:transposase